MNFNIIILLLLLVTIFLILKKNKLFIISLIMIIIVSILSKNTRENFSSLDILYPPNNLQTINKNHMLHNFKDNNNSNILYNNIKNKTCYMINNHYIKSKKNYILVKIIDNEYYTLNGNIYDINNSEIYLEKINRLNLKKNKNYGLKMEQSIFDQRGINIIIKPFTNIHKSNIPGFMQGENNGNIIINPIDGNLNSIFYLKNCHWSAKTKPNIDSDIYDIMGGDAKIEKIFKIKLFCNNKLYLNVSNFEKSLNNKKKVVLNNNPSDWYLFTYDSPNKNINDLYKNF